MHKTQVFHSDKQQQHFSKLGLVNKLFPKIIKHSISNLAHPYNSTLLNMQVLSFERFD